MPRQASLFLNTLSATGISLLIVSSASAEDVPSTGLLYNTKESHSLVYRCQRNNDNSLACDFIQTAVRKKAAQEDLNSKLDQAREEFSRDAGIDAGQCKMARDLVDILEGRKNAPREDSFKRATDMQKKDLLRMSKGMIEFCKSRTEESLLNMIRIGHEKDVRTCQVSSNTFKQSFEFVQDNLTGTGVWVVRGTPEGPCGIVQLSRLEPERLKDSGFVFWKYVARKVVTNPQGTFYPGVSCKGLDEAEYIYDWRSKEHSMGCDYVEFSAL